jgi:Fe-S-cluster-containing hydrogenase component 2
MAYVICAPCVDTLDTSCIYACPYSAIHPTLEDSDYGQTDQSFINPDECSNCGLCAQACPVGAIYPDNSVPAQWASYITKNADHFR